MKVSSLFILFFVLTLKLSAQNEANYTELEKDKSLAFGGILHTNGFGFHMRYSRFKTIKRNSIYELDLLGIRHPKEQKIINPVYKDARAYVFGKKNSLISIRTGLGLQYVIANKHEKAGLRVYFNLIGGPNFGVLKPVFLEIVEREPDGSFRNDFTIEQYDPEKHVSQSEIRGRASALNGIDKLGFVPGAYGKASVSFDWSQKQEQIKSIETGITLDAFSRPVPFFAYIENKNFFINLFVSITFGKRW